MILTVGVCVRTGLAADTTLGSMQAATLQSDE
jgi:hypothetical protein